MPVIERVRFAFLNGPVADVERWALDGIGGLLMGGSIMDANDGAHLMRDLGVTASLCLETEHSDAGKGVPWLHVPTPDDGNPKPTSWFLSGANFVAAQGGHTGAGRVYVHCQAGGSRTPAMVYFLLRRFFGHSPDSALALIRTVKAQFGTHPVHVTYIGSAEQAL